MRWVSHKPVTAAIVYAATGDLQASAIAMVGSVVPDLIEYPFMGLIKHRGITHLWPLYLLPFAALVALGHFYLAMFFGGAFLHLIEDGLSISGVRIWPLKKHFALKLYRTYGISEYVTAAVLVGLCAVYIKHVGYLDHSYLCQQVADLKNTFGHLYFSISWHGIMRMLQKISLINCVANPGI
jgi:hypothetical protein